MWSWSCCAAVLFSIENITLNNRDEPSHSCYKRASEVSRESSHVPTEMVCKEGMRTLAVTFELIANLISARDRQPIRVA